MNNRETNIKIIILITTIFLCLLIGLYKAFALPNIKTYFDSRKSIKVKEKVVRKHKNKTRTKKSVSASTSTKQNTTEAKNYTKNEYVNETTNHEWTDADRELSRQRVIDAERKLEELSKEKF